MSEKTDTTQNKLETLYHEKGYIRIEKLNESLNVSNLKKFVGNVYIHGSGYLASIFRDIINGNISTPIKNTFDDLIEESNTKDTINKILNILKLSKLDINKELKNFTTNTINSTQNIFRNSIIVSSIIVISLSTIHHLINKSSEDSKNSIDETTNRISKDIDKLDANSKRVMITSIKLFKKYMK